MGSGAPIVNPDAAMMRRAISGQYTRGCVGLWVAGGGGAGSSGNYNTMATPNTIESVCHGVSLQS